MLIEFLEKHRIEHSQEHHHSRPGWVQIAECPRCGSTNYHLGIKLDLSRAACYKCGGWGVAKLLKELSNAHWREVLALTKQGIYVPQEKEADCGVYTPPTNLKPMTKYHRDYLSRRGLDPDYCEQVWGFQGTGPFSNYPRRVFIPIHRHKKPVSWTARAIVADELRYQTAAKHEKSYDEKKWFYGMDHVKRTAIVVEGPLDAVNVGPGAIGSFGLALTTAQISLLTKVPRRIICFDNSPAAQILAVKLAEQLSVFPGETFNITLDAEDPGSASKQEIAQLRRFAFGTE